MTASPRQHWPDTRYAELVGIALPLVQAPMAGASDWRLAAEVAQAGGLGSIPCGMLSTQAIAGEVAQFREVSDKPFNLNFFCHTPPELNAEVFRKWCNMLSGYYAEFDIDPATVELRDSRAPFDEAVCELLLELKPPVVSFHYGLPSPDCVSALQSAGCVIQASATTVAEARWLEEHGAHAVIAQGWEAGGHRGMFLSTDVDAQVGTMALVPQVVDAVSVPVVAAGGIGDARGIAAAMMLGASAVQLGTAYLGCPESVVSDMYRAALRKATDNATRITNVLSGRPARSLANRIVSELGPLNAAAPPFPLASAALVQLRRRSEAAGVVDFSPLWVGQAAGLSQPRAAGELTQELAAQVAKLLSTT